MRLLPSLLLVALLVLLSPLALCTAPSPNATVLENVRALPCLSKLSRYLNLSYNAPIRALLSTCSPDNATVTLFAPTDSAVAAAHARIDALLRRSGYPPLEEIKRNITRAFNESESAGEIGDDDLHSAVDFHLAQAEPHLELLVSRAPTHRDTSPGPDAHPCVLCAAMNLCRSRRLGRAARRGGIAPAAVAEAAVRGCWRPHRCRRRWPPLRTWCRPG